MNIVRALSAFEAGASLCVALLTATFTAFAGSAQELPLEEGPPIRVVGPISQPYAYIDSEGDAAGFNVELIREIGRRLGRETVVTLTPNMEAALNLIARGEADVVSGVAPTPERARLLAFSRPFAATNVVLFALRDRAAEFANEDYSEIKIGVRKGAQAESVVPKKIGVSPTAYETLEEMMVAINLGEIDLIAAPQMTWTSLIRSLHIEDRYIQIGEPLVENSMSIGVSLEQRELLAVIDGALLDLMSEARFREIKDKWFGSEQFWTIKWVGIASFIIIIAILSISIIMIFRMRRSLKALERGDGFQLAKMATLYSKELERKNKLINNNSENIKNLLSLIMRDIKNYIVALQESALVIEKAVKNKDLVAIQEASQDILAGTSKLDLIVSVVLKFDKSGQDEINTVNQSLADIG